MDVRTAVLLLAGAAAAYVAFVKPAVGVALLVGLGVITVLDLLIKKGSDGQGGGNP